MLATPLETHHYSSCHSHGLQVLMTASLFVFLTGSRKKKWICGTTSTLFLVATGILTFIFSSMYFNEKTHKVHMYTTANEDQIVYHRIEVLLMSTVCMVEDAFDIYNLNLVLFTGNCSYVAPKSRKFTIHGHADKKVKGYYFPFVVGSSVNVSMNTTTGTVHYKWTSKSTWMSGSYCGQSGKEIKVSQLETFNHTGYYYICIIPKNPTSYRIDVTEYYYSRPITNECMDTVYHGSIKHKCCHFDFTDSLHSNCVYLATRNQQPDKKDLDKLHPVTLYKKYNNTVKAVTAVMAIVTFGLTLVPTILCIYCCCRARKARKAQQPQNSGSI